MVLFDTEFCEKKCPVCTRARRGSRWARWLQTLEMVLTFGGCPWGRARQRKYGVAPTESLPQATGEPPNSTVATAMGTVHFDAAAATWDDNPVRQALTAAIAQAIQRDVPLQRTWRVMEYGCGTASLGLLLVPHVKEVIAADASPGMIEQVRRKIAAASVIGLTLQMLDLTSHEPPPERFDLIVMAMALHHVEDTAALLSRLKAMLVPGGWLAIADLVQEDGSFHAPMQVPHNGFAPDMLTALLQASPGMTQYLVSRAHRMEKNGRSYEVFLLTARRA